MPMYRYICENCGLEKRELHSMNETPEIICDECGSKMTKAIGRVGIVFKGSGFYITDSKNTGIGNGGKNSSSNNSSSKDSSKESKSSVTANSK
ncbi:FmdB family transcriptional regulator [Thermosipho ferrireducens]|uniref:FmdB family transcriptional regulator n=1 Tax=Thermosipho ferrireducens TaxID=2571116 RepID=A0ABX7SAD2_9BACT|nr:FmdB family zinc ribbon protein [Thermosipho ferrireducens]QTA38235.1 FmdB family transcriptional regulator [Thermosipho ferrireducens]